MWDSLLGRRVPKEKLELTLDQEHGHINLLVFALELKMQNGAPLLEQLFAFRTLEGFLRANCVAEEAIMDECSFPLSKTHKLEHRSHYRSLDDLSRKINAAMAREASAALIALHQALLAHIRDKDQEVADWKRRQMDGLKDSA
jgi:hemerythrin